jgi:tRNA(fMet)-specific endonuclease VapC
MTYALDTNAVIHLLNENTTVVTKRDDAVASGIRFIIPPIVDYEIKRGFFYKSSPKKEKMYRFLVQHYGIEQFNETIWVRAADIHARLRRKGFTVGDADIFIAAFCVVNGYTLITANTKDYENINDLIIENWVE